MTPMDMRMEQSQQQRQQPRQRANHSQRQHMTMQARQDQLDEVRQWERDWREGITEQVRDVAKITGDVAGVVKEMQGDVKQLMEWKADLDKRKNDRDDKRPESRRADLALLLAAMSPVVYLLANYIGSHWKP